MKKSILIIVFIMIVQITSLTACAQTKVNMATANSGKEQAGNVLFIAPKNWQRVGDKDSANGQTIFVAPGANESTVITILPGEQLSGSLESWFEGFLAKNHSNAKVVSGGQIVKGSSDEGYEVVLVEETLQSSDGSVSYRFYVAAKPSNRVELIALISTDAKEYQQYKSVFDGFVQSLDFANLKNSKNGKNSNSSNSSNSSSSRSDNKNVNPSSVSSNALSGLFVGTTSRQQFNPNSKLYDYIVRQQYYLFSPNGQVYFGLPKADIRNIDSACQNDPANCGQYALEANQLQLIRQGQPQSFNLEKSANGFKLGSTVFYPISSFNGLKLLGTYSFRSFVNLSGGAGSVSGAVSGERSITFSSDGRFLASNFIGFAASGGVSGAASTTTRSGEGGYEINGNTLTLIYSNGRQEQFSFFVYPENEQESRPQLVVIGGVSYLLR
jgi:hypothetical protein